MEKIIVNFDNLRTEDINEKIYRPRAIMINSDKEILLGFCDNTFQFPGGFLEQNETLIEGLRREILEETGISLDNGEITGTLYFVNNCAVVSTVAFWNGPITTSTSSKLFFERIVKNSGFYKKNKLLKSIYKYFKKIIIKDFSKAIDTH